jgi:hypothetical protein
MTRSKIVWDVQGSISLGVIMRNWCGIPWVQSLRSQRRSDKPHLELEKQQWTRSALWTLVRCTTCAFCYNCYMLVMCLPLPWCPSGRKGQSWTACDANELRMDGPRQRPGEGDSSTHLRLATKQAEQKVGHARHGSGGCVREAIHSHGERARRGDGFGNLNRNNLNLIQI